MIELTEKQKAIGLAVTEKGWTGFELTINGDFLGKGTEYEVNNMALLFQAGYHLGQCDALKEALC